MTATERSKASLSPGIGYAGLSFVTSAVIVLVNAIVTSRLYGVDVIGQYGLAITPWLVLVSLSTVSEQVAMIRALAHMPRGSDEATGLAFAVFTMSETLTALMAIPVMVVSGIILHRQVGARFSPWPAVVIVVGYVVFENVSWNMDSVLSAFNEGARMFWSRTATVVVFLVAAIALYPVTGSVWGLTIATVVSFATGLVARLIAVRGLIGLWPHREHYTAGLHKLPDLLRYGLRLLPQQAFVGLTLQAPLWFIAGNATAAEIGAFSRASTMAQRLDEAAYRANEMLFPDLVRMHLKNRLESFVSTLARTFRLALAGLLLAAALGGGASEPLMNIFGKGFAAGAGALVFLLLAHVCFVACSMVGSAYNSYGKPQVNSAFGTIRFGVGLSLVVLLARYGITAASAGLFVGYFLELVVRVAMMHRILDLPGPVVELGVVVRLLLAYSGGFAASRFVVMAVPGFAGLVLGLGAGFFVFVGLSLGTHLIDTHDRNAILRRVKRLARS